MKRPVPAASTDDVALPLPARRRREAALPEAAAAADGPLQAAVVRIATLEQQVQFLTGRVDLLVDLMTSDSDE